MSKYLLNFKSDIKHISRKNMTYGFFTRIGGNSTGNYESLNGSYNNNDKKKIVDSNRLIITEKFKVEKKNFFFLNQIHSSKVIEVTANNKKKKINADGMITKKKGVLLGILTADCAPMIILGEIYVGIIHVGWRGLLNGIIENSIMKLKKKGEKAQNLICLVGPHLQKKSFIVKNDFERMLIKKNKKGYITKVKGKLLFNFSKLILYDLKNMGVKKFEISKIDTYSNPELFFSYRYSKNYGNQDCGRQISVVGII